MLRSLLASAVILILLSASPAPPLFTDVSATSGAAGVWDVCGVGAADLDNDGFLDLCATAVNGGSTRIYHNNGDGTFSDVANSGVGGESQACIFGDVNNDGLPDLWVGWYWTNSRMFLGTGGLNPPLTDITGSSGTGIGSTWEGGAFADVDNDGNLDLLVVRDGGNKLYMGDGTGHFSEQGAARGVQVGSGSRAVAFADVNGDGYPDLFIGTGSTCALLINDGTGHFTDNTVAAGLSGVLAPGGAAIQVAVFGDFNNDGAPDLYIASWNQAWLFMNDGSGHFIDVSVSSGISPLAGSPTYAAPFGCAVGDFDNDGFLDLFIGGGEIGGGAFPNLLFHNNGNGTFTDVAAATGVQDVAVNHVGAIFFDMDNDGDLDLFVGHNPNQMYRNETNNSAFFKVRVSGTISNRSGIGSKIWVYDAGHLGDPLFLRGFREVSAGSGQASCPPAEQHFGLPTTGNYDLKVRFPSGTVVNLPGKAAGQILSVVEPAIPAVVRVDSSSSDGTYGAGALIPITIAFSAPVTVTGTPLLTLVTGAGTTPVAYTSGSGGKTLVFLYTVAPGDSSPRLDYLSSGALALSGGTIKLAGAAQDAVLTLPTPGASGSLGVTRNLVIDGTIPGVTGVSSVQANGTYHPGQTLTITVTFSENVTVAGTPQLALATSPAPTVVNYLSGSGTPTLQFSYPVTPGQSAGHLDLVSSNALTLNGGSIVNAASTPAVLSLPAPGAPGSLGANRTLVIDGVAPTVSYVSSPNPNGSYGPGSALTITVAFSKAVTVTGVPQLTLATGASPAVISYSSGSGSNILSFSYVVRTGDHSDALDVVSSGSLVLNGGTIQDSSGNIANLTLPVPGATGSLSSTKSLQIVLPISLAAGGCGALGPDLLMPLAFLLVLRRIGRRITSRIALVLATLLVLGNEATLHSQDSPPRSDPSPTQEIPPPVPETPSPAIQDPPVPAPGATDLERSPATLDEEESESRACLIEARGGVWTHPAFQATTEQGIRMIKKSPLVDTGLDLVYWHGPWTLQGSFDSGFARNVETWSGGLKVGLIEPLPPVEGFPVRILLGASVGVMGGRFDVTLPDFGSFKSAVGLESRLELFFWMGPGEMMSVWAEYRDLSFKFEGDVLSGDTKAMGSAVALGAGLILRF